MRFEPVLNSADKHSAHAHWIQFCDSLKAVGAPMIADGPALSELDLAEGLRYFAHLALASIQRYIDGADPARPLLYPLCDERIKSGGDNPDNRYFAAPVSAEYEYLLTGYFGECSYFSVIGVHKDRMTTGTVGEYAPPPELNSGAARAGTNGMTEIRISAKGGKRNDLRISPDINMILVRATLERPPTRKLDVTIRRIDGGAPVKQLGRKLDAVAVGRGKQRL